MSEVAALRSLEGEVIDAGLFEAAGVRLVRDLDAPITMEPDDWQVLVSLVQPFTFDHIEARVGRGGAVRIFHTLHRLGVAEALVEGGDDESEWLDQLAGGLSPNSSEPTWLEQVPAKDTPEPVAAVEVPAASADPEPEPEPAIEVEEAPAHVGVRGVSAHASTTLTDGVYDEIRRLRSKASDGR
jgi:hypothetical protein